MHSPGFFSWFVAVSLALQPYGFVGCGYPPPIRSDLSTIAPSAASQLTCHCRVACFCCVVCRRLQGLRWKFLSISVGNSPPWFPRGVDTWLGPCLGSPAPLLFVVFPFLLAFFFSFVFPFRHSRFMFLFFSLFLFPCLDLYFETLTIKVPDGV